MDTQNKAKRKAAAKTPDVEVPVKKRAAKGSDKKISELLDQCQKFHYDQSSNFSKLARSIVFGVIGTIWILSYSAEGFTPENIYLISSLIAGFVYLVVDVCHYFWDARFYRMEYFKFEREKDEKQHDDRMNSRSRLSYRAIWGKFIILIIVCALFVVGFVKQYDVISQLF